MTFALNNLNQPVGLPLPQWQAPPFPTRSVLTGRYCRLEPLDPAQHAKPLFNAFQSEASAAHWTYLPYGPFEALDKYRDWLEQQSQSTDPLFMTIVDQKDDAAVGLAAYLRITPASGSIEVGHLNYTPRLQHTTAATEAMSLMMAQAFELGYRRYEWKCDALNAPSRRAAERLGFTFEGVFRQATVVKGRNRDTAWYAVLDSEWPRLQAAFIRWLDPANFDASGRQRFSLSQSTATSSR